MTKKEIENEERMMMQRLSNIQSRLWTVTGIKNQKIYNDEAQDYVQFPVEILEYRVYIVRLLSAALSILKIKKLKNVKKLEPNDFFYTLIINSILKQLEPFYTQYVRTNKIVLSSLLKSRNEIFMFKILIQSEIEKYERELKDSMLISEVYDVIPFDEPEIDEETGGVYDGEKQYFNYYKSLYYSTISKKEWNKNEIEILNFYEADFGDWESPRDLVFDIEQIFETI